MLEALNEQEQEYSVELGEMVVTEMKLELVCRCDEVDRAVALIQKNGSTGQANDGWIYVTTIEASYPINQRDSQS
jgi:nitrogen regulatory protein P-II 1